MRSTGFFGRRVVAAALAAMAGGQAWPGAALAGDPTQLLFPLDETYTLVDFFENGAPDQGNDDDSTGVALGFPFDLYGESYTDAFINNNGNVSFATPYGNFSASGFPDPSYKMVAAFWADVDTRYGNGQVWQKQTGSTLVVTWDNVGYFSGHGDLRNTFQIAISDGGDPVMGIGNNICLSYSDMSWTTGDASSGSGGFGGTPATAGANRGNGVDFVQIGRFDHEGTDYDGPSGNSDGVSYLDDRTYCFNGSSNTSNIDPIAAGFPVGNVVDLDCSAGDILDLDLSFLSPEAVQTTTVTIDDVNSAAAAGLMSVNTPGNTATVALDWTPTCGDVGSYVLDFTATDNFSTPGQTSVSLTINVIQPCGNGITSGSEQCDDGNNVDGDCCSADCEIEIAGTGCRAAVNGVCDSEEVCDGSSPSCPANVAAPEGTACPPDGNVCTDDVCDGAGTCGVANTASCEDSLYCNGTDVCSGGVCTHPVPPCGNAECSTCDEGTDTCSQLAEGNSCSDDGNECTNDQCDGLGDCGHPPIVLAPACDWIVVTGSEARAASVKTRSSSNVRGSVCADSADVGVSSELLGAASWVLMEDSSDAARVRSLASVENGSVVTAGGCLSGSQGFPIFGTAIAGEICCGAGDVELPGGNPANVVNACGTSPLLTECSAARSQVDDDAVVIDGLTSTQQFEALSIRPGETHTISATTGLNVVDFDRIKIGRGATLAIDAQGNNDAVVIVRMARGFSAKEGAGSKGGSPTVALLGGMQARNLLFYAADGNCGIGLNNVGSGTFFCPQGKVRVRVGSEWSGAIVGSGSVDIGIGVDFAHVPFLGLAE